MYKPVLTTILFSFALLLSCNRKDTPIPVPAAAPTFTTGIGGMRHWHGHHYYSASGPHFPTAVNEDWNFNDTSFAIIIVNDSTVNCMGKTYEYNSSDSVKQIHFFGLAWAYYYFGPGRGEGVAYYYARDSILYLKNEDVHGTTDSWLLDNKYYTY